MTTLAVEAPGGLVLEVDDERAEVVRSIFRMSKQGLGPGLGPGPTARRLNAYGTPGTTGKPWGRQTVTDILHNPLHTGELHGIKRAQPVIISRRTWNQAQ